MWLSEPTVVVVVLLTMGQGINENIDVQLSAAFLKKKSVMTSLHHPILHVFGDINDGWFIIMITEDDLSPGSKTRSTLANSLEF